MPRKRKTRRQPGTGSIFKSKGKTYAAVRINGKKIVRLANSNAHAQMIINELKRQYSPASPGVRLSFADWSTQWLADVKQANAPTTYTDYKISIANVAELHPFRLDLIQPSDIERVLAKIAGPRAREKAYVVLRVCLNRAVARQLIQSNPMETVGRPRVTRKDIDPFTSEEMTSLLARVQADDELGREALRHGAMVALGLICGVRVSEGLGLQWDDYTGTDLEIKRQTQRKDGKMDLVPPKSKAGYRRIPVPTGVQEVLATRRMMAMKEGLASCPQMFPTTTGTLENKDNFRTRVWDPLLVDCDIRHRGYHHCRHTCATNMLTAGVPVHVVSRILGHGKPSVTLDMYAHWIPINDDQARAAMEKAIRDATG